MNEYLAKNYYKDNDIFGEPQIYKGIDFYPLKIKESKYLGIFNLMAYPKNFGATKEIFKMSFIKFMVLAVSDGEEIRKKLEDFLSHITKRKVDIGTFKKTTMDVMTIDDIIVKLKFDDIEISEWEFEEIREIILEQNGLSIEYVHEYHPEMEENLHSLHKGQPTDLSDQVSMLVAAKGLSIFEIGNYTLKFFKTILERIIVKENYDLYQPLIASGAVKLKSGEIKNWMYHSEESKGRYGDILVPVNKFAGEHSEIFGRDISKDRK